MGGVKLTHCPKFGVRKHLLNDLYIRFFRLAEKRIGEQAEYGIVSYISNSSFLTGRSHPIMRESLLGNFQAVWIDRLNGDKYKTGKVIPDGLPDSGRADQSIFTTEQNAHGIQVGTCISTFLKRRKPRSRAVPTVATIQVRDFWGMADRKRAAIGESLGMDAWKSAERAAAAGRAEGPREYESVSPTRQTKWRFASQLTSGGFEDWPSLEDLFPANFMGVHTGKDAGVVGVDRNELVERFAAYTDPRQADDAVAKRWPALLEEANEFDDPSAFRHAVVRDRSAHDPDEMIRAYLFRPLDQRVIWYDTKRRAFQRKDGSQWSGCLVQRYGEKFAEAIRMENEFLCAVSQARQVSEARPMYASNLVDLHLHDRGTTCFPARFQPMEQRASEQEVGQAVMKSGAVANLSPRVWRTLRERWQLEGTLADESAVRLVRELFRLSLAILHSPAYEAEHRDSLAQDWAHLPIPHAKELFKRAADLGETIAILLDPARDARSTIREVLGDEPKTIATPQNQSGSSIAEKDLVVTYTYYGGGKGRWEPRAIRKGEGLNPEGGEETGDLWLNDRIYVQNIARSIWEYELGGYPVVKKWLGYRDAKRRDGRGLTVGELDGLRAIVHRIAALLRLYPQLDLVYGEASADAFSGEELGLELEAL